MAASSIGINGDEARSSSLSNCDFSKPTTLSTLEFEEDRQQQNAFLIRRLLAVAVFVSSICFLLGSISLAMTGSAATMSMRSHNECYDDDGLGWVQIMMNLDIFLVLNLSFSQVKLIDISTNLIVGQGGRALHAWVAYHIFSDAITRVMETSPVTYNLYISTKFNPTSIESAITYIRTVYYGSFPRHQWLAFWFCWATIYVLAFPTLVGASAGYFSPLIPYYALSNGLLVNMPSIASNNVFEVNSQFRCMNVHNPPDNQTVAGSATYIGDVWGDIAWNIKSNFSVAQSTGCGLLPTQKMCVQMGGYNWAISRWMVVTVATLELIFVCGIFAVWWDANTYGKLNRNGHHRTGIYRNILDISKVMVDRIGDIHSLQTDKELKEASENETIMLDIKASDSRKLNVRVIHGEPVRNTDMDYGEVEAWNTSASCK